MQHDVIFSDKEVKIPKLIAFSNNTVVQRVFPKIALIEYQIIAFIFIVL